MITEAQPGSRLEAETTRPAMRIPIPAGEGALDELLRQSLGTHDAAVTLERDEAGKPIAVLVRPTTIRSGEGTEGCRLCGAPTVKTMVMFRGLEVGLCPQCRAGQVMRLPVADALQVEEYAASYESEKLESKAITCWELFKKKTGNLTGITSILDVGCGTGAFLDLAKGAGLRTGGIEIALDSAVLAVLAGHEVLCSAVPSAPFPVGHPFDAVVMWDILEHLRDPGQALADCYAALAPGGRLFVLTPMMGTVYDRLGRTMHRGSGGKVDQLLRMCWSQDHLFRFDRKGICATLQGLGFGEVRAEPIFLLSLKPGSYAGGSILPSWTGNGTVDRTISVAGVRVASGLRLHNKMLIEAVRNH